MEEGKMSTGLTSLADAADDDDDEQRDYDDGDNDNDAVGQSNYMTTIIRKVVSLDPRQSRTLSKSFRLSVRKAFYDVFKGLNN